MREFEIIIRFSLTVDIGEGSYLIFSLQGKSGIVYTLDSYSNLCLREN